MDKEEKKNKVISLFKHSELGDSMCSKIVKDSWSRYLKNKTKTDNRDIQ